jgi:hypothetical protein
MSVENAVDYAIGQTLAHGLTDDQFILYKDGVKVAW